MATLEQIETAIRNADKAGRSADVLALAKERQRLLAEQNKPAAPAEKFVRPQAPSQDFSQVPAADTAAADQKAATAKQDWQDYQNLPWWKQPLVATGDIASSLVRGPLS